MGEMEEGVINETGPLCRGIVKITLLVYQVEYIQGLN
jgi:hypothetical protein